MTLVWVLVIGVLGLLLLLVIFGLVGFILGIKWAHAHLGATSPHQPPIDRPVRQVFF